MLPIYGYSVNFSIPGKHLHPEAAEQPYVGLRGEPAEGPASVCIVAPAQRVLDYLDAQVTPLGVAS